MDKFRNPLFDVIKGIGIILMIIVHCNFHKMEHFAYTFHMPLFFFIAGYFMRYRSFREELYVDIRRLIVPYLAVSCVLIGISFVYDDFQMGMMVQKAFLSSIWGGAAHGSFSFSSQDLFIGPMWFLLAMCWIRLLFCGLNKVLDKSRLGIIIALLIALAGQCIYGKIGQIPMAILPALSAFGFFYCGYLLKKFSLLEKGQMKRLFPFCIVSWVYCVAFSTLAMHNNTYDTFYIIDLFGALGAFLVIYTVVEQYYSGTSKFWNFLTFVGKNSIIVLCVHAIDHCFLCRWTNLWEGLENLEIPYIGFFVALMRLTLAIGLAYLIFNRKKFCNWVFYLQGR